MTDQPCILCLRFFDGTDKFLHQHPYHLGTDLRVAKDITETAHRQFVTNGKLIGDGVVIAKIVGPTGFPVATFDGFIWFEPLGENRVVR